MNHWKNKSPEERAAIIKKGVETRRKNAEAEKSLRSETIRLKSEIASLYSAIKAMRSDIKLLEVSKGITGKYLLDEDQIVKASESWKATSGVYFLVDNDEVVYIGQSKNIYARLSQHEREKSFQKFTFVPCGTEILDKLESLYIHTIKPRLNGNMANGAKQAPLSISEIIGAA